LILYLHCPNKKPVPTETKKNQKYDLGAKEKSVGGNRLFAIANKGA